MNPLAGPAPAVYEREDDLPDGFSAAGLPAMPHARGAVLCPPDHFDVVDVKNPFMAGKTGTVDVAAARRQWAGLRAAFERAGVETSLLEPLAGCEDMVFCANTAFLGLDARGRPTYVPARMTFASRHPEVAPMSTWCAARGYRVADVGAAHRFEGTGDAIWHPGRRLIWGGYGARSEQGVYAGLAREFETPVFALALRDETYYHLDTCFCPIDERTVLVFVPAIADDGMRLVRRAFERVIEVDGDEAARFACNATAFFGRTVFIDRGAAQTAHALRGLGYEVVEVDTGEFMKSGGSVFCMKNAYW